MVKVVGSEPFTETDSLLSGSHYRISVHDTFADNGYSESTISPPAISNRRVTLTERLPKEIDNVGSTARDFYAAERNYLSWFRLSLAIISTGVVALDGGSRLAFPGTFAEQLRWLLVDSRPVAVLLFSLAAFCLVAPLVIFFLAHAQLAQVRRPLLPNGTLLMPATLALLSSIAIIIIRCHSR